MTMRRLAAGSLVLTLALCFGRVAAWAALAGSAADAHACCPAPEEPQAPGITRCCPDAAAVSVLCLERHDALISVLPLESAAPSPSPAVAPEVPAPPGPQARLSSAPARAPPLG